jgi:hypothetical protein
MSSLRISNSHRNVDSKSERKDITSGEADTEEILANDSEPSVGQLLVRKTVDKK